MPSEAGILLSRLTVLCCRITMLQLGKQERSKDSRGKRQGISYQLCQEGES